MENHIFLMEDRMQILTNPVIDRHRVELDR